LKDLVIVGGGGYASEVLWAIDALNAVKPTWNFLGFIDSRPAEQRKKMIYDHEVLGGFEQAARLPAGISFSCAIGHVRIRKQECLAAEAAGWRPATLIHPSAIMAKHVALGDGTIVAPGAVLGPNLVIGRHCSINFHVSIGHDARVGDFCVISPGARVSGGAELGDEVFLGSNATVHPNVRLGSGSSLGANSFRVTDLPCGATALGVPARRVMQARRK
jgi:sugar O-acyltransferase (sialic acid O-acetyltransferase NeuD family)